MFRTRKAPALRRGFRVVELRDQKYTFSAVLRRLPVLTIVLLTIDLPREPVLLALNASAFADAESPAGVASVSNLPVQMGLAALKPGGFAWRKLAGAHTASNTSLLIHFSMMDAGLGCGPANLWIDRTHPARSLSPRCGNEDSRDQC